MPYPNPNEMKTDLGRVRGMGSAKSGAHHWLSVKITAIALIPLTLWFLYSFLTGVIAMGGTFEASIDWIKKPYHSFPLALLLAVNFYHAELGGQEIIIDYVHKRSLQIPTLILYKFFCYGLIALSLYSVLYITFKM